MAKIIGLVNQKGGVAKTTTASALAFGLGKLGKKVLLIDFDPQGNLSSSCGIVVDSEYPPALQLLGILPGIAFDGVTKIDANIDIIVSNIGLETANIYLSGRACREQFLRRNIAKYNDGYDYIIIDSNPSLSLLTLNVLVACDELIIPFKPEYHSLQGINMLFDTIREIQSINSNLTIKGFLATLCDKRRKSTAECLAQAEKLATLMNSKVYDSSIRIAVAAADAPSAGINIYDYKGGSAVADDYGAFVEEFLSEE